MFRKWLVVTKWCLLLSAALALCLVVGAAPAAGAGGVRYVDKYVARNCQGKTPCYHSIQAAVNNAQPGDTIYVFPATYEEGVNLNEMDPQGDITLITVDANGNPTPGTVTVDNPGDDSEIYTGDPVSLFDGDVTIDGFVLRSEYGGIDVWVGAMPVPPDGDGVGLGVTLETRDVEIRNVDASHTGGDGITVKAMGKVTITDCTTNDNEGHGIGVLQAWGDVTITGCTSNENNWPTTSVEGYIGCGAAGICVMGGGGQITIRDNTANGNAADGIRVGPMVLEGQEAGIGPDPVADKLIIDKCTANNNYTDGIAVLGVAGDVIITDCTTNDNGEDGVFVGGGLFGDELGPPVIIIDGGDVLIQNCTSNGNDGAGFDPQNIWGTLSIQACIAMGNEDGVDLDYMFRAEAVLVYGSIICGNECGVYLEGADNLAVNGAGMNLEGNWWGCAGGPEATACDPICEGQVDSIAVDFTPWISKITDSATVDPVMVGEPTVVSFQFSANPSAVYLGQGPGDLRGPAPFAVTTDNGRLDGNGSTVHKFLGPDGTLKVTLVPDTGGTATVTVSGPCGLTGLEGFEAVVEVLAEEFVPEPGTVLLLGSGLLGLAGYAGLRMRKR